MIPDIITIAQSMAFCFGVSAHAFRWKSAGKVKAIGVHVNDPIIAKNLSNFFPINIVTTIVNPTSKVLVEFLAIYLFLLLDQPS